jgi:multiple sugar transport system permease protein/putative aldouronate transport system permease protein
LNEEEGMSKQNHKIRLSRSDKVYLGVVYTLLGLFILAITYPLLYVISASFSSPAALIAGRVYIWPVDPGFQGYKAVFENNAVWRGYWNTIVYTSIGTVISVFLTMLGGFVLSRKEFPLRLPVTIFFAVTMFFNGGLIPTYLLISSLKMVNTIWAIVLPGAFSVWLAIIVRTFIQSTIPEELYEATSLDGGNYFDYLFRIVWPLSLPVVAVLGLSFATGHWNSYFTAMIYLNNQEKFPLQMVLRSILIANTINNNNLTTQSMDVKNLMDRQYLSELLKYSLIIVSSVPLIVIYPFIQKFFIKGIMVGSIKG